MKTLLGYKKFIDLETGEEIEVPVIKKEVKNKNFEMIFYGHLVDVLDDIGNSKIKVLKELISNRTKAENIYKGGNVKALCFNCGVSYPTGLGVVKLLEKKNLLKRSGGIIYLNPNVICDGRFKDRIMHEYIKADTSSKENRPHQITIDEAIRDKEKEKEA